jgi:hypothetical protein
VVQWCSLCLDRAAEQLATDGFPVTGDLLAASHRSSSITSTSPASTRSSARRRLAAAGWRRHFLAALV